LSTVPTSINVKTEEEIKEIKISVCDLSSLIASKSPIEICEKKKQSEL
jgi:hypothetical protein